MAAVMNSLTASSALAGKIVVSPRSSVRAVARPRSGMRCEATSTPPAPKWSETMAGASAPLGAKWDPLGFMKGKDENQIKVYLLVEHTIASTDKEQCWRP